MMRRENQVRGVRGDQYQRQRAIRRAAEQGGSRLLAGVRHQRERNQQIAIQGSEGHRFLPV